MEDSTDINNVIRHIQSLQADAERCLRMAYYSQNGKGGIDEGLLRKGQKLLNQANEIIKQNLVPLLQSVNPAEVATILSTLGVAGAFKAEILNTLNLAKNMAKAGMETARIIEMIEMAFPFVCIAVGAAIAALLYSWWLDRKQKQEEKRVFNEYQDRMTGNRPKYVPFQPRFTPGRL